MINAARVTELVMDSLFRDEEVSSDGLPSNAKMVEGVTTTFAFHSERLESHREEVAALLEELPDEFFDDGGGGWSFMNLPMTKDQELWGEQRNAQELLALALGLDLASYQLPRDMWDSLPGSMPYIVFHRAPAG